MDFENYIIGFFEGDGHLQKPGKQGYIQASLYQHEDSVETLYRICNHLGTGKVYKYKNRPFHRLSFSNKKLIHVLIQHINGNLRTPKRQVQFKEFLFNYNKIYNSNIEYLENMKSPSWKDGWLSGFIDSDGTFITYRRPNSQRVELTCTVGQKEKDILDLIYFGTGCLCSKPRFDKSGKGSWKVTFGSLKARESLIIYLDKFPLYTKKLIKYNSWKLEHQKNLLIR